MATEWEKWPDQWSVLHEEPPCEACGQPLRYTGSEAGQHMFECVTRQCTAKYTRWLSDADLFGETIVDGWRVRPAAAAIGDRCAFCGEAPYRSATDGAIRCTDCSAERSDQAGQAIWRLPAAP